MEFYRVLDGAIRVLQGLLNLPQGSMYLLCIYFGLKCLKVVPNKVTLGSTYRLFVYADPRG